MRTSENPISEDHETLSDQLDAGLEILRHHGLRRARYILSSNRKFHSEIISLSEAHPPSNTCIASLQSYCTTQYEFTTSLSH